MYIAFRQCIINMSGKCTWNSTHESFRFCTRRSMFIWTVFNVFAVPTSWFHRQFLTGLLSNKNIKPQLRSLCDFLSVYKSCLLNFWHPLRVEYDISSIWMCLYFLSKYILVFIFTKNLLYKSFCSKDKINERVDVTFIFVWLHEVFC